MASREQIITICLRLAATAAVTYVTFRYMARFLDPNYDQKEEVKRKVAFLFKYWLAYY